MHTLRIHKYIASTIVDGPGRRASIFVQGCPIRCAGCAVPETWDPSGGQSVTIESLAREITATPGIEGVTFLGGEPFAQAAPLASLAARLRQSDLSVITFTGYNIEEITQWADPHADALIALSDIVIDGPFISSQRTGSLPLTGSANQRYHFFTDRYRHIEKQLKATPNRLEIRISPDGTVFANGLISGDDIRQLVTRLTRDNLENH